MRVIEKVTIEYAETTGDRELYSEGKFFIIRRPAEENLTEWKHRLVNDIYAVLDTFVP